MKKKKKFIKIITIIILLIIISLLALLNLGKFDNYINDARLEKLNYSKDTIKFIKDNNLTDDILANNKHSKTLEAVIAENSYENKNLQDYLNIDYAIRNNFVSEINNLLKKGYTSSDINTIFKYLDEQKTEIVIKNDYIQDLDKYLNLDYFKQDNLLRYIKYQKDNTTLSYTDITTYVNIGLDNDYYTNVINIDNPEDPLVICNKYHKLSNTYVPKDLIKVDTSYASRSGITLKKDAYEAFKTMVDKAKEENITLLAGSGYRSYQYQSDLYNNYVKKDGLQEAETYSARPGYSEHQTGLAIDVKGANNEYINEGDKEYNYLINNSYKYGYIVRYPKDKEKITGYIFEPWHVRYVGVDVATYIHNSKITFDEYIARK